VRELDRILLAQDQVRLDQSITIDPDAGESGDAHEVVGDQRVVPAIDVAAARQERERFRELLTILTPAERATARAEAYGTPRPKVSKQAFSKTLKRAVEKMAAEAQARGWRIEDEPGASSRWKDPAYLVRRPRPQVPLRTVAMLDEVPPDRITRRVTR
jgi:hypothetical protein